MHQEERSTRRVCGGVELTNAREMVCDPARCRRWRLAGVYGLSTVIMSIIGPIETHDYRNYTSSAPVQIYIKRNQKKKEKGPK